MRSSHKKHTAVGPLSKKESIFGIFGSVFQALVQKQKRNFAQREGNQCCLTDVRISG